MTISRVNLQRNYTRQSGALTAADKNFIEMGGFVRDLVISRKMPDLPTKIIDRLKEKTGTDKNFAGRLSELSFLNKRIRTLYRKYIEGVCVRNDWSKWKTLRALQEDFTEWFLKLSIDLKYTDRHDDYLIERYHIDLFAGEELKKETMRLLEKLEPLELIIYCAWHGMSYQYLSDLERLSKQLGAEPIFIQIISEYLDDNVDFYIREEEYIVMYETLNVSESDMKIKEI